MTRPISTRLAVAAAMAAAMLVPPAAEAQAPSREMLDRYCVTCHNERLQTAGLMLDQLDLSDIAGNAEMLEKMVHKLRNGQMPPEGRPRPDVATLTAFLASLQTALDRVAVDNPDPGRVASRRLNRLEYANAVNDLLALEIDSEALLPSDMAGFGFDNNADVLSITPSLMARYIAAATKISRAAVGSPDNPADHAGLQGGLRTSATPAGTTTCRSRRSAASPCVTTSRSTASMSSRFG